MARHAAFWSTIILVLSVFFPATANPIERIAFQRNDPSALTVMFADGKSANDLPPSRRFTGPYITPSLAPDGVTIVFAARVNERYKLFRWRLDETNVAVGEPKRLLVRENAFSERFPAWSPDGKFLAFIAIDEQEKSTIQLVRADGTGVRQLAVVNHLAPLVWSPDSKQLFYIDAVKGKPVLMNIPAAGGTGIPFRAESQIIAACFSPDAQRIAAMIQQGNGLADLYVLRPFGVGGGQAVLKDIAGVKAVAWRTPDAILFNASKVGTHTGKAFWTVTPQGTDLRGVTGYADPKQISYFSLQYCDLTPYVPEPDLASIAPPALPDDLSSLLLASPVTLVEPKNGEVVRGAVPLRIIARPRVAKVVIRINGQLIYEESTSSFGERVNHDIPQLTYQWDTQGIRPPHPASGLPASYRDAQNYPDASYAICVQGVDESDRLIGQQIVTLTVRNEVERPAEERSFNFQYGVMKERTQQTFHITGSGLLLDEEARLRSPLNAELQVLLRRNLDVVLPNGNHGLRTQLMAPDMHYALSYSGQEEDLPEFAPTVYGAYSLTPFGELFVATMQEQKLTLPLAQFAVPLKGTQVSIGDSWQKPMSVVADLFTREASTVNARHTLEGIEWVDNRQMARIRSDFSLAKFDELYLAPTTLVPGEQGERTALISRLNRIIIPHAAPDPQTTVKTLRVRNAAGVRFSWFDLETQQVVRAEDMILFTIPSVNQPDVPIPDMLPALEAKMAWYQVRYHYRLKSTVVN